MVDGGNSLLKSLRAIAYGFSAKSKVKIPGFAEIEASFVAKDMIERSNNLTPDPLLDRSLYYEAFESLSKLKFGSDKTRIVIIVDDLDRCFPDLAIKLLESIKLVLSQPGFVFIIGVARTVIEGYLGHRYAKEYGISDFNGHSYLDKIVQLPFNIPPHTGRMNHFTHRILERVDKTIHQQLKEILPIVGEASGANPRAMIRFVNNLLIDIGINKSLFSQGKISDIPIEYFAITRCLQQKWPNVFRLLMSSEDLCKAASDWNRESIKKAALMDDNLDFSGLAAFLISDRDLFMLLQTAQGKFWLKDEAKRNEAVLFLRTQRKESRSDNDSSVKQFDIFFSYTEKDRKVVVEIAEKLTNERVRVFLDTFIEFGSDWNKGLENALNNARGIAVCISADTIKSEGISKELNIAIQKVNENDSFRIFPIMLPGSDWLDIPDQLRYIQAVDFRAGVNAMELKKLAEIIKK